MRFPFAGIIVPLLTPLTSGDNVDKPALRALIRHCLDGGVDGLFVGGTAGLGPLLTERAWRDLMETAMDEVGEPDRLQAGAIAPATGQVLEKLKILEDIGYRWFVATPPFYLPPRSIEDHRRHFSILAESTSMKMIIYNIPACTGAAVPEEVLLEFSSQGISTDCKDSSGDTARFEGLCERGVEAGLGMYMGLKPDFARLKQIGARGCVPVPANVLPGLFAEAWKSPGKEIQARIDRVWDVFVQGTDFLSASVYALSRMGIGSGRPLTGQAPANEFMQQKVDELLREFRVIRGEKRFGSGVSTHILFI